MKAFVERMLGKVFAQKAHDPSFETMTAYERREAEVLNAKPRGMTSELVSTSASAAADAREAMAPRHMPMTATLADESLEAREQAEQASVKDGSHLRSEPVDDSETALADARDAGPHDVPHSPLVDDSEEARDAAARASEPSRHEHDETEEREEKSD
jgi:hypothetical protein